MSEPNITRGQTSLRVERLIPASIDEVFEAWTDPPLMARWLSPTGHAEVEADVRVGGAFRVVMFGEDMRIEHTGEYLILEPPGGFRLLGFRRTPVQTRASSPYR